jgi:hypothetical protein
MPDRDNAIANDYERSVRFSHALYGAIIITAELVVEYEHADSAAEVIWILLATGAVLLLAHSYSAVVASRVDGRRHELPEILRLLVSEVPVLTSLLVPLAMFSLAWLDLISLKAAFAVSIGVTVLFLFGLGVTESLRIGRRPLTSFAIGLVGGLIGVLVILLEASLG